MKIAVACDHGGLVLKNSLLKYLRENGYEVEDFGTCTEDSCDYPDFALPAAEAVARGECERGILICSTGIRQNIPVCTMMQICSRSGRRSSATG